MAFGVKGLIWIYHVLWLGFKDKWFGILHYVVNEYEWRTGMQCCDHEELTGSWWNGTAVWCCDNKPDTPPNKLVLQILRPANFPSPATQHGIQHEKLVIDAYIDYQQHNGCPNTLVTQSGFIVNSLYPFLGVLPDGTMYDSSNEENPFGFIDLKCPY